MKIVPKEAEANQIEVPELTVQQLGSGSKKGIVFIGKSILNNNL